MPSFSCCSGMWISALLHFPKKVTCSNEPLDKQEKAINLMFTSTSQLCSDSMEKSCMVFVFYVK